MSRLGFGSQRVSRQHRRVPSEACSLRQHFLEAVCASAARGGRAARECVILGVVDEVRRGRDAVPRHMHNAAVLHPTETSHCTRHGTMQYKRCNLLENAPVRLRGSAHNASRLTDARRAERAKSVSPKKTSVELVK